MSQNIQHSRLQWLSWMRRPTGDQEVASSTPAIFSMVILSLPLIQEGQFSVSGERMCTILVNKGLSLPSKRVVR